MRVVVTGATGNAGTSVVEALGDEPAVTEIVGIARRRPDWEPAKTTWVAADVSRDELTPHLAGAAAVIHLAWRFQPTHDHVATWESNVLGSMRVFDAVARAKVPALIHASSIGAYSPRRDEEPVDESWPTHALPTAAYGREKSYLERVLDTYERRYRRVRVVRMRPAFIFKQEASMEQKRIFAGSFVPARLMRPAAVPVVPDVDGLVLQAVHARDVADAYRRAVVQEVSGAFNLAAEPVIDADALAEIFEARKVKVPPRVARMMLAAAWRLHAVPASPGLFRLALTLPVMDTTRARKELGWQPTMDAIEVMREFTRGLERRASMPTPPLHASNVG